MHCYVAALADRPHLENIGVPSKIVFSRQSRFVLGLNTDATSAESLAIVERLLDVSPPLPHRASRRRRLMQIDRCDQENAP
jgi:hypothetical protein